MSTSYHSGTYILRPCKCGGDRWVSVSTPYGHLLPGWNADKAGGIPCEQCRQLTVAASKEAANTIEGRLYGMIEEIVVEIMEANR